MTTRIALALPLTFALAAFALRAAADKPQQKNGPKNEGLERFKLLAGDWVGTMNHDGAETDGEVHYKVTSAGSAVVETIMPGTDHE
ncbi:MAG TPA: hypothetical protein VGX78_11735, partial [Pirellulales bacterium]|nr:hypothetical protein [Pirellulales bacterium]